MSSALRVAAVDLGATSGRVVVGTLDEGRLDLEEVHRFANGPVPAKDGSLHWDVAAIWDGVLAGLRAGGPVDSIGVDSWAVDYGLIDADGVLLGDPFCYRDDRTRKVVETVLSVVGAGELFAITGLQQQPFNTVYQLAAERDLSTARSMLLMPDLMAYWLTGAVGAEATNASTTQLYDVRNRSWAVGVAERVGVPRGLLPPLREAGDVVGVLLPDVAARSGQRTGTPVVAVGSHDTASAVVGVPFTDPGTAAYISSGTWSLVGLELPEPVLSEAARAANFTNEGGVDGTIRFLRNVMGLWVLGESMRAWGRDDLDVLLWEAAAAPAFGAVVDVEGEQFLAPGDMPTRIERACRSTGQDPPVGHGAVARCVLESLALAYRRSIRLAAQLSGRAVETVHVVGGGVRNELLCQLTADACGVLVLAGPVEAAALGNVLVQARALGADLPDLAAMRDLLRRTHEPRRYEPRGEACEWDRLERLLPTPDVVG